MSNAAKHRLLLDTNILLDAALPNRPDRQAAYLLLEKALYRNIKGYVCATSLKDFYYVLAKASTEPDARKYLSVILDFFEIIPVDAPLCKIALTSNEPDFEDGLVRAAAESIPVDFLISRDEAAFKHSPIKRLSAQEYIDLFDKAEEISLI